MKNRICLLFLSFLSFQLVAQEMVSLESDVMDTRFYETDKIPVIKGKLLHYSPEAFKDLEIKYSLEYFEKRAFEQYTDISPDGQFEIKLPHPYAYQEVSLHIGDYFYGKMIAHDELLIEADLSKLKKKKVRYHGKGIQFKGPDGELNTYFNKFENFRKKEKRKYYDVLKPILMNRESSGRDKRRKYLEHYQTWDKILADYVQQHPSKYSALLKNDNDAKFYAYLFSPDMQQDLQDELFKKGVAYQPLIVSNAGTRYYKSMNSLLSWLSPAATVALLKEILLDKVEHTANYQKFDPFLKVYQLRLAGEPYDNTLYAVGDSLFLSPYKDLIESAKLASIKEKIEQLTPRKADIVKFSGRRGDKLAERTYYENMLLSTQTKWVKDLMQKALQEAIAYKEAVNKRLQKANELTTASSLGKSIQSFPFGANLYKAEVTEAEMLLATIQNAFPNKSIILDVWATWCAPCIYDMKNSTATKKALKELPVEVVYLCVKSGSSHKKWANIIAELKTTGNHIFLEKELYESVINFFDLKGVPRYIFINKEGEWDKQFISSIANLDIYQLKKRL